MKTLVLSMISIAATVAAMTACTSESDPIDDLNPKDAKVEIKMTAGVGAITTKAAATTAFNNTSITLLRQDVNNTGGVTDWGASAILHTYSLTGENITLDNGQKYFNNDVNLKSIFVGYSNVAKATNNNNGKISYTITGQEDLLCTQELNVGTKTAQVENPELNFKHLLSQVEIKVVGTTKANDVFGQINTISLIMPTAVTADLKTATATATSNAANESIEIFDNTTNPKSISDLAALSDLGSVFVLPGYGQTGSELKIEIATTPKAGESKDIEVSIDNITTTIGNNPVLGLQAGYKHVITLTFNDNITITSSIESIGEGGNGSGEIGG